MRVRFSPGINLCNLEAAIDRTRKTVFAYIFWLDHLRQRPKGVRRCSFRGYHSIMKRSRAVSARLRTLERVFLRIGALLAVVTTAVLLYSEFAKPRPPYLELCFALTESTALNYAEEGTESGKEYTLPFPL